MNMDQDFSDIIQPDWGQGGQCLSLKKSEMAGDIRKFFGSGGSLSHIVIDAKKWAYFTSVICVL